MNFRKYIYVLGLLMFLVSGCKKFTENRLKGIWVRAEMSPIDNRNEEWEFTDNKLTIYFVYTDGTKIKQDEGEYKVKTKLGKRFVELKTNNKQGDFFSNNGEFQIVKLNKNKLRIVTDDHGGLVFREFSKK